MPEQHETFPNALEALLLIVALIVIEIVVAAAMFDTDFLVDVNDMDASGFITVVGNGILFIGLMAYKRIGYGELFHPSRHSVRTTLALVGVPIVLLAPGLVVFAGIVNSVVIMLFPLSDADQSMLRSMSEVGVVPVLFSCLAAPVLEEMLFRGVMLRAFLRQYPAGMAIFWSAALFAVAHLNLYQLATALAIGLVSGWLYERCRSLWPCILLHATYNSFVTWSYWWADRDPDFADSGVVALAMVVVAVVAGWVLRRLLVGARP